MFRGFAFGVLIAAAGIVSGCVATDDIEFSARNAQVELDLHSFVRGQSNELLEKTQNLLSSAQRGAMSPRKMGRNLESTVNLMDQIHMNLPSLLADQDVEIADMRQQVRDGSLNKAVLKQRSNDIQTYRKALLASLNASAVRAASTVEVLKLSGNQELTSPAHDLSRDLHAARTMIEMQL